MKINMYVVVFGIVAVIAAAALLSINLFDRNAGSILTGGSGLANYGPAPNIQGISSWINSEPISLTQLHGKVVLIDFWTYSCINCIRTIPLLNALYQKYHNDGLVIIGVHTPEFPFEHNYTNVYDAVQRFGITYPVALDNNYATWTAFHNEYWPADYLINASGDIVYESFGEGNFNRTQEVIQLALRAAGYNVTSGMVNFTDSANFSAIGSPEMYFGYSEIESGRTNVIGNQNGLIPGEVSNYTIPGNANETNVAYLSGLWNSQPYYIESEGNNSELFLYYKAKSVNIVASGNSSLSLMLDRHPLNGSYLGSDARIVNGSAVVIVNSSRLYNLVSGPSYGTHEIEIRAGPGVKIYTFTFG